MAFDFKSEFLSAKERWTNGSRQPTSPSFMDLAHARNRETGFMSANRWLVLIMPNQNIRTAVDMRFVPDVGRLASTCRSVTLNEKSWFTTEENYINSGPTRVIPYKRNTNNSGGIKLTFNCGSDMFEREFFESWFSYLQNPVTRQWRFYDDYARESEVFVLLLPKQVKDFPMAMEAMQQGKITGVRLTEVYPYGVNLNGGTLGYEVAQSPLSVDVTLMYRDIVPIKDYRLVYQNSIPTVTETGYPKIEETQYERIMKNSQYNLNKAVNGFIMGVEEERTKFIARQEGISLLEAYAKQLDEFKRTEDFPRAVDGRVVYSTPRQGGLDYGLTLLSQTQGFFGTGYFGG